MNTLELFGLPFESLDRLINLSASSPPERTPFNLAASSLTKVNLPSQRTLSLCKGSIKCKIQSKNRIHNRTFRIVSWTNRSELVRQIRFVKWRRLSESRRFEIDQSKCSETQISTVAVKTVYNVQTFQKQSNKSIVIVNLNI